MGGRCGDRTVSDRLGGCVCGLSCGKCDCVKNYIVKVCLKKALILINMTGRTDQGEDF